MARQSLQYRKGTARPRGDDARQGEAQLDEAALNLGLEGGTPAAKGAASKRPPPAEERRRRRRARRRARALGGGFEAAARRGARRARRDLLERQRHVVRGRRRVVRRRRRTLAHAVRYVSDRYECFDPLSLKRHGSMWRVAAEQPRRSGHAERRLKERAAAPAKLREERRCIQCGGEGELYDAKDGTGWCATSAAARWRTASSARSARGCGSTTTRG